MWIVVLTDSTSPADTSGPWWGEAAIAGGFLIAGVLLTFITAAIQERLRSKKDLARRFDNEIREAGALFLIKADALWDAETKYYKLKNDKASQPSSAKDRSELASTINDSIAIFTDEIKAAIEPLEFIASDRVVGAARKHYTNIVALTFAKNYNSHRTDYYKSRQDFVDQVRRTIKLPASKIGKKKRFERFRPQILLTGVRSRMKKMATAKLWPHLIGVTMILVGLGIGLIGFLICRY